jgi:hypothetical protein
VSPDRFLDAEAKEKVVAGFEQAAAAGEIDARIKGLCRDINRQPGMVTLFSCEGHGMSTGAYVTLWMDEARADAFRFHGSTLARQPYIWGVSIECHPDGQERQTIKMAGDCAELRKICEDKGFLVPGLEAQVEIVRMFLGSLAE